MASSRRRLDSFDRSQWSFTIQQIPRGKVIPRTPGRFGKAVENRVIHSQRGNRFQSLYFLADLSQHTTTPDWEANPSSKQLFDYLADILRDVAQYLADIDMQAERGTRLPIFNLKTQVVVSIKKPKYVVEGSRACKQVFPNPDKASYKRQQWACFSNTPRVQWLLSRLHNLDSCDNADSAITNFQKTH